MPNFTKAGVFAGLTYILSYLLIGLYLGLGGKWVFPGSYVVAIAFMFVPMTMAIVVRRWIYKEAIIGPLRVSFKPNKWWLVAWLLPPAIALATLGVGLLFPGVRYDPEMTAFYGRLQSVFKPEQLADMQKQAELFPIHPLWIGLLQGLIAGVTVNAVAGFGEELGWRGFLQKELEPLGFWRMSALIGVIWGFWHAPIILQGHNYPQHPILGVFLMVVLTLLLAPIFSFVRCKADSVIAAAILHGSLNAMAGIPLIVTAGGSNLTIGLTGLAGFIVLAVVNISIFMYDRAYGHDEREPSSPQDT